MHYQRSFQIGQEEATAFQLHQAFKTCCILSTVLALGGGALCLFFLQWKNATGAFTTGIMSFILFFVLVFFTVRSTISKQVASLYEKGERKPYRQQVSVDGAGLEVRSGKKTKRIALSSLKQAVETRTHLYLYVSKDDAYILPKAQMEDPEAEMETLRAILREFMVEQSLHLKK